MTKTNRTVTIAGCGALGSHVAQFLRNEGQLRVIDFDRVEAKNMLSQFHGKPGGAKLKVTALHNTMNFLWGTKLDTNSNKLVENNASALLGNSDLIIDCLDNGAARRVVQAYARAGMLGHSKACLHGALAADGGFGRVIWDESFVIDDEDGAGAPTCEDGLHLPFIALTAAYIAYAAQKFLREGKQVGFQISPAGTIQV
jgi:molybdopterin/thiamine biosynthesis adenylyltransferase